MNCEAAIKATAGLIDDDPVALTATAAAISQYLVDQQRASVLIERALALDPNNAWAWARYGWAAVYTGQVGPARERFKKALQLSPLDPLAFNIKAGFANIALQEENYQEVVDYCREALAEKPGLSWIYRLLAVGAAMNGDMELAREAVRKLLDGQPHASIERVVRDLPARNVPGLIERYEKALRLAGLPEK